MITHCTQVVRYTDCPQTSGKFERLSELILLLACLFQGYPDIPFWL